MTSIVSSFLAYLGSDDTNGMAAEALRVAISRTAQSKPKPKFLKSELKCQWKSKVRTEVGVVPSR